MLIEITNPVNLQLLSLIIPIIGYSTNSLIQRPRPGRGKPSNDRPDDKSDQDRLNEIEKEVDKSLEKDRETDE